MGIILQDPFFSRAAASEGSMVVPTVQARGVGLSRRRGGGLRGDVEILKLLRVPRGSVRGKMRKGLRASCYPGERSRYRAGTPLGSGRRVDAKVHERYLESNSAGKQCGGVLWKTVNEFANLARGNRKRPGGNPARGLGFFEVLEKPTVCGTRKGGFRAAFGPNGVGP
jgi:hypothetical protein